MCIADVLPYMASSSLAGPLTIKMQSAFCQSSFVFPLWRAPPGEADTLGRGARERRDGYAPSRRRAGSAPSCEKGGHRASPVPWRRGLTARGRFDVEGTAARCRGQQCAALQQLHLPLNDELGGKKLGRSV